MAFEGPIEDRVGIRERYDAYSDAVTRADVDDYLECWSEDGVRTGDGGECSGRQEIREHFQAMFDWMDRMAFFSQLASIEVEGGRATASANTLEFLRLRTGDSHRVVGSYRDELIRDGGIWRFASRHYRVLMEV